MKTDKEMTQNILNRVNNVKKERTVMKRKIYKITALSCALAIVFIAAFTLLKPDIGLSPDSSGMSPETSLNQEVKTSNPEEQLNRNFFVMVANAADNTETILNKETNVKIPLGGILVAEDTSDMTVSERDVVMLELKNRLKELYGADCNWQLHGITEDVTVYFGTADCLRLKIEDADSVENIKVSCTENGRLTFFDKSLMGFSSEFIKTIKQGTSITFTGKEYKEIYGKDNGMPVEWFLSEKMINAFQADPCIPLSSVNDKIEVTINFIDGTSESFAVELTFDDDGMLTSTYRD